MNKKEENDSFSAFSKKSSDLIKEHFAIYLSLLIFFSSAIGYLYEYILLDKFGISIIAYAEIQDFLLASLKIPFLLVYILVLPIITLLMVNTFISAYKAYLQIVFYFKNIEEKLESVKVTERDLENTQNYYKKYIDDIESLNNNFKSFSWYEKIQVAFPMLRARISSHKNYNSAKEFVRLRSGQKELIDGINNEISSQKKEIRHYSIGMFISMLQIIAMFFVPIAITFYFSLKADIERIVENPPAMATVQLKNRVILPDRLHSDGPLVFITATNKFLFFYQHGTKKKTSTYAIPTSSIINIHYSDFIIGKTPNQESTDNIQSN